MCSPVSPQSLENCFSPVVPPKSGNKLFFTDPRDLVMMVSHAINKFRASRGHENQQYIRIWAPAMCSDVCRLIGDEDFELRPCKKFFGYSFIYGPDWKPDQTRTGPELEPDRIDSSVDCTSRLYS